MMMNHSTNALFFDNVEIPAESLIGEEGKGFCYILDGMNAERILVALRVARRRALVRREGRRRTRTSA
jgi:alkylation response protein AidB-like acyl-CoA dehydrogenase